MIGQCRDGKAFHYDEADADLVTAYRWFALPSHPGQTHCWYVARTNGRTTILLHRQIMEAPRGLTVDHIDGNGLNNCRDNLRLLTHGQNIALHHNYKRSKTGYLGVYATDSGRFKQI